MHNLKFNRLCFYYKMRCLQLEITNNFADNIFYVFPSKLHKK